MNKLREEAREFATALKASTLSATDVLQPFVIPPFPSIADVAEILAPTSVRVGAQNMHWQDHGAWTGEVSAPMIRDCGATLVELGHSERRTHFSESDAAVALKVRSALQHGLTPLVCIGDTREEFEAGQSSAALERQTRAALSEVQGDVTDNMLFAYEPVWSIGESGVAAEPEFVQKQHRHIKAICEDATGVELPVLYGGSVTLENCRKYIGTPLVDGLFIGRAAWEVSGYLAMLQAVIDQVQSGRGS